jgi:NAD(P)-dependent dehydrogenase (short-subunit alcohol dehydrogenase family)
VASALVSGASSGIGRAIAEGLAADGLDVTGLSRTPASVALPGVTAVACDVTREADCVAAVAAHVERCGGVDVLVNSAGVLALGASDALDAADLDRQLAVNVRGVAILTREALPHLAARGGLVVNLASVLGLEGAGGWAAYAASKHAVVGYTRSLNDELAGRVRATALCPSYVETPMNTALRPHDRERLIRPGDMLEAVRFLRRLSPQCLVPELEVRLVEPPAQPST